MNPIDINYLKLQFWNKVFRKNGKEFQTFFERIMKSAFPDFEAVKPYGKIGDKRNDGFRKSEGIYYQVYSPESPAIKQAEAARKLKSDAPGLIKHWQNLFPIKEYFFVFNEKDLGVAEPVFKAVAELKKDYPDIKFDILLPHKLENIFFNLSEDEILSLEFNIDLRQTISNIHSFLESIKIDLDRNNSELAIKALQNLQAMINNLQDSKLELEFEILKCRALQSNGEIPQAKEKYQNLIVQNPHDVRPLLYLAEIYLEEEDLNKNEELLKQAEKIDSKHWLLKLEKLIRQYRLNETVELSDIDENTFPGDKRIKSIFYRIYSLFYERGNDHEMADEFIEKAVQLNPDRAANYDAQLSLKEERLLKQDDTRGDKRTQCKIYLGNVDSVIKTFQTWDFLGVRNKMFIGYRKLTALLIAHNFKEIETIAEEIFEHVFSCHLDPAINTILCRLLMFLFIPDQKLDKLLKYLQRCKDRISEHLVHALIFQFCRKGQLLTKGKEFFQSIDNSEVISFINNIANNNIDEVVTFLKQDVNLMVGIAYELKDFPNIREQIIRKLPEDKHIRIKKIWILFYYDAGQIDRAFDIIKTLDLSYLNKFECEIYSEIAHQKQDWEIEAKMLERLLQLDLDKKQEIHFESQLFTANFNLERFSIASDIGESLLDEKEAISKLMDDQNKEILLGQTIIARLKRGEKEKALILIEQNPDIAKTFEFKTTIEADVYLRNNDGKNALKAVIEGIKSAKHLTPEQYGSLFPVLLNINELFPISLESLAEVRENCFVKIKGQEQWYYLGNECELDTTKILPGNRKHSLFIRKKIGDNIEFPEDQYHPSDYKSRIIESILPVEGYILFKARDNFYRLSKEGRWDSGWIVEVPKKGETLDTSNIIAFLQNLQKSQNDFFDLYCKKNIPLALLAVSEGGLTNTIGKINQEERGFIHLNKGTIQDFKKQKEVADKIINGALVYLDGTSALFLTEMGIMDKIVTFLPNLNVPQSVINSLFELADKFHYMPAQVGHMGYARGRLQFGRIDSDKRLRIEENIKKSIKLLESKPENIQAISNVNKLDVFTEQRIPPEICDACILAQRKKATILTEDFLYLQANSIETNKDIPEYCSSFALIKALFEQERISFNEYLDYFSYLSYYRCHFLPVSTDDLLKAVFIERIITILKPENLRKFNLSLVLSKQYGTAPKKALQVIVGFLGKVLIDNSITPELSERIFWETISPFLKNQNRIILGRLLFELCRVFVKESQEGIAITLSANEKLKVLEKQIDTCNSNINTLYPKPRKW